jgi:hypothetical protein
MLYDYTVSWVDVKDDDEISHFHLEWTISRKLEIPSSKIHELLFLLFSSGLFYSIPQLP